MLKKIKKVMQTSIKYSLAGTLLAVTKYQYDNLNKRRIFKNNMKIAFGSDFKP